MERIAYQSSARLPHVNHEVAKRIAGTYHPPGTYDEKLVRPHVPIESSDVCMIYPDPLWYLWGPVLADKMKKRSDMDFVLL